MLAITGITGQVGGQVARALLEAKQPVRAVLRDPGKASPWRALGCEAAFATMDDETALRAAFTGADAAFVLLPPVFDPSPGFAESRAAIRALTGALSAARPERVVALSTIGAQATHENLLTQLQMLERAFDALPMPVSFLRPAWFIENTAWDIESARHAGVIHSFLQPTNRPVPMVATADVARVAAGMLMPSWDGPRIVELEGPARVSPDDIADRLARLIGRDVRAQPVARETWEALFRAQGMRNPTPRMRMLDGFNEGWIEFEGGPAGSLKGRVSLDATLRTLLAGR